MKTILNIETCRANLYVIQETCDKVCEQEPSLIMEHLNELASLLGLSAMTNASLTYHYNVHLEMNLQKSLAAKMPPSMMKVYAESLMPELTAEIKLIDRLHSALVHKIDALRSMLSYEKQERFFTNQNS